MKGSRRFRSLILVAATFVLAAAAAQAQVPPILPDPGTPAPPAPQGNSASQSIGVVQVGPATVDPTAAVADTPLAGAAATTEATVGDTGANNAQQSGGVVQAGGNNTATRSAGVVQVSHSRAKSSARARAAGVTARASLPATIGGSGANSAGNSVVAVQVGSGNTANGATGAVQIKPTTAGVDVAGSAGQIAPAVSTRASISGDEMLAEMLGVSLTGLATVPASTTKLVLQIVHSLMPGVSLNTAIGELIDSGTLQISGDGDNVRIDLGSLRVEIVSLVREPSLELTVIGTQLGLGAIAGVPNTGESTASGSLGTVQAGGGNTATDSIGTAQVGSLVIAPAAALGSSELGTSAALGGSSGVAGGGNSADGSIGVLQLGPVWAAPTLSAVVEGVGSASTGGTSGIAGGGNYADGSIGVVQIGGGNNADGSAGAVQAGTVTATPTANASVTPLDTSVGTGGSSRIGGGGNVADGSIGAVQIGGGNLSSDSIGTAQSRSIDSAPTASAAGTTVAPVINLGGSGNGPGNTATGSIAAIQIGVANTSDQSIGTAQVGSTSIGGAPQGGTTPPTGGGTTPPGGGGTTPTGGGTTATGGPAAGASETSGAAVSATPAAAARTGSVGTAGATAGQGRPTPFLPPANASGKAAGSSGGGLPAVLSTKLPFTGIALWLALLVAGGLLATGTGLRRVAPRRTR